MQLQEAIAQAVQAGGDILITDGETPLVLRGDQHITILTSSEDDESPTICGRLVRLSQTYPFTFRQEYRGQMISCSPSFGKLSGSSTMLQLGYHRSTLKEYYSELDTSLHPTPYNY